MLYTEAITFTEFEIAWILGCLALGSILAATIGFGDALIIIPLLSLIMNPRSAIVFIGYWGLFMNIVNITKYRSFTEKKYIGDRLGTHHFIVCSASIQKEIYKLAIDSAK